MREMRDGTGLYRDSGGLGREFRLVLLRSSERNGHMNALPLTRHTTSAHADEWCRRAKTPESGLRFPILLIAPPSLKFAVTALTYSTLATYAQLDVYSNTISCCQVVPRGHNTSAFVHPHVFVEVFRSLAPPRSIVISPTPEILSLPSWPLSWTSPQANSQFSRVWPRARHTFRPCVTGQRKRGAHLLEYLYLSTVER